MITTDKSLNKIISSEIPLINNALTNNENGYKSSQFVIPFLLSIYNVQPSSLTEAVSETIIALDNLAQIIDSKLDSPNGFGANVSTSSFEDLKQQILDCFSPLAKTLDVKDLYSDTLRAVNISFELNVLKRGEVYNLLDCNDFLGCTMYYALPLVEFINQAYAPNNDIREFYCLLSNFIQCVDDFVDVFRDLSEGVLTPITARYSSYQALGIDNPFLAIHQDVLKFLEISFSVISKDVSVISKSRNNRFIEQFRKFIDDFNKLEILNNNLKQQEEHILKMIDITPPILCYSAG